QVVRRLLEREPDERFQHASEVVAAIDELLRTATPPDTRLFTQLGGSPREMLGSRPSFDSESGSSALPSFADESDRATLVRPPQEGVAPYDNGLDPIGPSSASKVALHKPLPPRRSVLSRLQRAPLLEGAIRFVEARRSSLPPPIGHAFKGVPGLAILLGAALALLGILVVLIVLIARAVSDEAPVQERAEAASSSAMASAAAARAANSAIQVEPSVETALAAAKAQGLPALEALAKEQPGDGAV